MKFKNKFYIGLGLLKAHLFKKRIPLNVSFSVTNRCNLRCSYCDVYKKVKTEIPTEKIFSLIDELAEMGTQRLGFWGGEPLLRNDIGELVKYADEKDIFTTIISNGYLVPQKIDDLKKLGLLILSLDGPEEVHDANRGKGSYKRAMEAIKVAVDNNIPVFTITVLTKTNLNSIDFILDVAEKMNFLTTFQVLYYNSDNEKIDSDIVPSPEEYRDVIKKLIDEKKNGSPIASSKAYFKHLLNWNDYKKTAIIDKSNKRICWGGKLFCNIEANGDVYPCDWMIGKVRALNFMRDSFMKAWEEIAIPYCTCIKSCYSEYNLMFSFNLNSILNGLSAL